MPVSYLRWLANTPAKNGSTAKDIAKAELKRRGTTMPTIELSGHAIDRASLNCRSQWHATAKDANEGIYSWLARIGREALDHDPPPVGLETEYEVRYVGLKIVFVLGDYYPTMKTVMPL